MQTLFTDAVQQYIDVNGKTRVLFYDSGVSLSISPIPPLDLPEVSLKNIQNVDLQTALEFIHKHSLKITEKHSNTCNEITGECDAVDGLWLKVNDSISFGYIFVDRSAVVTTEGVEIINRIPFSEGVQNPIIPSITDDSELVKMRKNYKIAEYLKQYSLIEYAYYPNSFGVKNYSIRPTHDYAIPPEGLGTRLKRKNAYFYSGGKIVVHDEDTRDRLILFAQVSVYNDPSILKRYKVKQIIEGHNFYKCLSDFRSEPNQLLFSTQQDVIQWKIQTSKGILENLISPVPLPNETKPYYYRNLNIEDGKLMIIQNTAKGDFPSALAISKNWEFKHINTGYNTTPLTAELPKELSFKVFTEEGRSHFSYADDNTVSNGGVLKIFAYLYGEGRYAAALFL